MGARWQFLGVVTARVAEVRSLLMLCSRISHALMTSIMDALVDQSRDVDGKPTSLADLGYTRIGMDDNWQACGTYIIIALIPVPPPQPIATATSTEIAVVNILRNRIISHLSASAHI